MLWDVASAKERQACVYCISPDVISPFKLLYTSEAPAVETVRRSHPHDLASFAAITLNKHGHKTFPLKISWGGGGGGGGRGGLGPPQSWALCV